MRGNQFHLWNRIGEFNGRIYYDLANKAGEVVEIDECGWGIITNPPILFRREQHQRAQVRPERGARIERLWDFSRLSMSGINTFFLQGDNIENFEKPTHSQTPSN
ncbi:MAG TPA: hypothetical protein ENI32_05900 [Candidatus Syntrophoarchaeum butanivorans]|uniref:Uncharacterized protein n=1 Tax=Candidatus Syntropharchaeum butanivorans TaxID=1839936 RepID=A0A1F2P5R7_9EURY|nr:MAG: hypothetical protein SBU_000654 [Candidatus Syntrophoarchaeum butanivorans]HEC57396.1 hypothetical protein [Candidatus Syntrophoarchaeum butanivorans]